MSNGETNSELLLDKLAKLQDRMEVNEKFPGISCSKPQDQGCFQNFLSARECPQEQICTTMDEDRQIYRCKTPTLSYSFKCGLVALLIVGVVLAICFALFSYVKGYLVPSPPSDDAEKADQAREVEADAREVDADVRKAKALVSDTNPNL